jgi:hypothetical protein
VKLAGELLVPLQRKTTSQGATMHISANRINFFPPQEAKTEIRNLLNTTLEQNYIKHNGKWYKQIDGLAMGAPTSAILAEVFIQYFEHTTVIDILKKFQIIDYYRYIDDILIIYNAYLTNIDNILS